MLVFLDGIFVPPEFELLLKFLCFNRLKVKTRDLDVIFTALYKAKTFRSFKFYESRGVPSCCNLNEESIGVRCRVGVYWNKELLQEKLNMADKKSSLVVIYALVVNDVNSLTIPEAYHQGESLAKLEHVLDLAKERVGKGTYTMTERLLSAVVCMATRIVCCSQIECTPNQQNYAKSCTTFERYAMQTTSQKCMQEYGKCYNVPTFTENTYQSQRVHLRLGQFPPE